ncbi:TetR/AcrR family transcriptional regulator [Azotosporobacter soli]|uniref:TetR/AcrR family transcriptional regulator n=1 Tax=Azotosporobacter soli TaxID=3055040 RepID=UPI0031FE5FAA
MNATTLKEIALAHFAEKGYDGTSLSAIAADAGIKKPSIYAHFPSKLDLFLAIARDFKADYVTCWREALESSANLPPDRRLGSCFQALSRHYMQDRIKMAFWIRLWMFPPTEIDAEIRHELQSVNGDYVKEVERIFRQGRAQEIFRAGAATAFSHAYFCLLDGYLMRAVCFADFNYAHAGAQIWNSFLEGVLEQPKNNNEVKR